MLLVLSFQGGFRAQGLCYIATQLRLTAVSGTRGFFCSLDGTQFQAAVLLWKVKFSL